MSKEYINAMVAHMYAFESGMTGCPDLLTEQEIADFYHAYCGGFCPLTSIKSRR